MLRYPHLIYLAIFILQSLAIFILQSQILITQTTNAVLVTPLIAAGKTQEARNLTSIDYKGTNYGYAGHFTTTSLDETRDNHLYTWFQPCSNCDSETAPLLIWLQGGPGG